jgi:hypothetical protein
MATGQPSTRVHNEIPHAPLGIVKEEVMCFADLPVLRVDPETAKWQGTP